MGPTPNQSRGSFHRSNLDGIERSKRICDIVQQTHRAYVAKAPRLMGIVGRPAAGECRRSGAGADGPTASSSAANTFYA
jgi:hypothetical protein